MCSSSYKPLIIQDLSGSNSTLLGGSREALQAFQPTESVGVGSPVCLTRIRVQKRFGHSYGLAFRFQVHFGIDAGRRDVGVAQPAPDRDHVDTRLQDMGSGGVPQDVGIDALAGQCRHGVGGGTCMLAQDVPHTESRQGMAGAIAEQRLPVGGTHVAGSQRLSQKPGGFLPKGAIAGIVSRPAQ